MKKINLACVLLTQTLSYLIFENFKANLFKITSENSTHQKDVEENIYLSSPFSFVFARSKKHDTFTAYYFAKYLALVSVEFPIGALNPEKKNFWNFGDENAIRSTLYNNAVLWYNQFEYEAKTEWIYDEENGLEVKKYKKFNHSLNSIETDLNLCFLDYSVTNKPNMVIFGNTGSLNSCLYLKIKKLDSNFCYYQLRNNFKGKSSDDKMTHFETQRFQKTDVFMSKEEANDGDMLLNLPTELQNKVPVSLIVFAVNSIIKMQDEDKLSTESVHDIMLKLATAFVFDYLKAEKAKSGEKESDIAMKQNKERTSEAIQIWKRAGDFKEVNMISSDYSFDFIAKDFFACGYYEFQNKANDFQVQKIEACRQNAIQNKLKIKTENFEKLISEFDFALISFGITSLCKMIINFLRFTTAEQIELKSLSLDSLNQIKADDFVVHLAVVKENKKEFNIEEILKSSEEWAEINSNQRNKTKKEFKEDVIKAGNIFIDSEEFRSNQKKKELGI